MGRPEFENRKDSIWNCLGVSDYQNSIARKKRIVNESNILCKTETFPTMLEEIKAAVTEKDASENWEESLKTVNFRIRRLSNCRCKNKTDHFRSKFFNRKSFFSIQTPIKEMKPVVMEDKKCSTTIEKNWWLFSKSRNFKIFEQERNLLLFHFETPQPFWSFRLRPWWPNGGTGTYITWDIPLWTSRENKNGGKFLEFRFIGILMQWKIERFDFRILSKRLMLLIETEMGGMKPVVTDKKSLKIEIDRYKQHFMEFSNWQDPDAKKKIKDIFDYTFKNFKVPTETLIEEAMPFITKKRDFFNIKHNNKHHFSDFVYYWDTDVRNKIEIKWCSPSRRESFVLRIDGRNEA